MSHNCYYGNVIFFQRILVGEKQPSGQFVMPEEVSVSGWREEGFTRYKIMLCCRWQVGAMVVYLCSDEARQVTGATLSIDGGWTAT